MDVYIGGMTEVRIPDYRIASFCTSPSWGGLEMNVLRFLRWMQQRGWKTGLYAPPDTRMFAEAPSWGLTVYPIRQRFKTGDVVNAWRLARQIRKDNVKRLIIHQSQDMCTGALAKRMAGPNVKLIYHQHMHVGGAKKDFYHAWLHQSFDAWVTPVQWLADRVLEKTTVDPKRIHIIPRGNEIDKFIKHQPGRIEARRRYQLPEDVFLVGVVGRLDPKKCQDVVIEAVANVRRAGHNVHLLLIGNQSFGEGDEYVAEVHAQVKRLGLSDVVHFRPHDDEVEWAYAGLDIFVLASKSECYGMVTTEAMSSGIPVIGTNDGGTVSMIEHGRNGLLVTPKSVDELTSALLKLINDPAKARQLATTAREEAKTLYSHTHQCEQWEKLLLTLA